MSQLASAAAFAAPSPKPEFWGMPWTSCDSCVPLVIDLAGGASSSVRPALAIVGSLWTGYSVVSTAGDSSTGSRVGGGGACEA